MSGVFEHLDEAVERLSRVRDALLADVFAVNRAARLAAVFESEARAWSQLYELSSLRLVWRAALAAEAGARANAALWAARAVEEQRVGLCPVASWTGGRVGAPRRVALSASGMSPRGGDR